MAKKKKPAPKRSAASTRSAGRGSRGTSTSKTSASKPAAASTRRKSAAKTSVSTAAAAKSQARGSKGPAPAEIGRDLVTLVNLGKSDEAVAKWYHARIESVEGDGQSWKGMKALRAKNAWWLSTNDLHSCQAEGPYAGATGFAVRYTMAFTPRDGQRIEMTEVGVYTVRNGKIVREEYMYAG